MKRAFWISLLAIFAFAVILIIRLPVQWVAGFLPRGVSCRQLAGTVWNGTCSGLVAQGVQLGNVAWDLQPSALLSAKVAGYVELKRGADFARGDVEAASGGRISVRNLQTDMPLDPMLIPQLPRGLSGIVRANLGFIHLEKGVITTVQGLVETHDLVQGAGSQRLELGGYSLTFPAADPKTEPVGKLTSLEGPLEVEGTLRLTREPGFVLEGLVAAKPDASPKLVQQLQYLGAPDAQGRRQFSVAATF